VSRELDKRRRGVQEAPNGARIVQDKRRVYSTTRENQERPISEITERSTAKCRRMKLQAKRRRNKSGKREGSAQGKYKAGKVEKITESLSRGL
jgi:hypothetical protein